MLWGRVVQACQIAGQRILWRQLTQRGWQTHLMRV